MTSPVPASPDAPAVLRLVPDRARAVVWTGGGLLLVAMCAWIVADAGGAVPAWVGLAVAVAVTGYFAVPVLAPGLATLVLDADGVRGRSYHLPVEVPWSQVQIARVVEVAGEPVLQLHLREPSPHGDPWRTRAVGVLLPLGCDLGALHAFLAARLGRRS